MKTLVILLLCQFSYLNFHKAWANSELTSVPDYYWRDYYGLIPSDALPGGTDEDDNPTYIGQFSIRATYNFERSPVHTIPGTIYPGTKYAIGPYNGQALNRTSSNNLKILCVRDARKYRWAPITQGYPAGCQAVIGGFEDSTTLYIGRTNHNNQKVIGKIFSEPGTHYPNLIIANGTGEAYYRNYEILAYCC